MKMNEETMDIQFDYDIIKGENVIYHQNTKYTFPVAGGSASHWLKRGGKEVVNGKVLEGTIPTKTKEEEKVPKIPVTEPEDQVIEASTEVVTEVSTEKVEDTSDEFPVDEEVELANVSTELENKEENKSESKKAGKANSTKKNA